MNALDEVPQLDQTRRTTKTHDHEYVDLEMIKLLSKLSAFCEEEKHAIMDNPFVPFHIRINIARHLEFQNMVGTTIDQP